MENKNGRLTFNGKERARFFGVCLLPPTAFLEAEAADQLADRLARSGVNLVRLGDLDSAYGPNRSLFDDARDDTKEFDPVALARLDHMVAALKKRGIYVAVELASRRRFRADDGVALPGLHPSGGGPAAFFDPRIGELALASARALLAHENPETGLALKDDPTLAWVTLMGENSMFDLIDNPDALPAAYAKTLRELGARALGGAGHRFWESIESDHLNKMAVALRKDGLKAPVAGVSHWRREPEFCAAQAGPGLDLIDDRIYWGALPWASPEIRSTMLWGPTARGLAAVADAKRRAGQPYVLGQWCNQTLPAWSFPHEAADHLLGAFTAMSGDWDGLIRRGLFLFPSLWGEGPAGTVGGEDIFQIAEVLNGSPHIYALWPHAASLFLRGRNGSDDQHQVLAAKPPAKPARGRHRRRLGPRSRSAGLRDALHPGGGRLDRRRAGLVPSTGALDYQPLRRAGGDLDQRRADRKNRPASRLGNCASRAHRFSLGKRLETRDRRSRSPTLPSGTCHRHGHLAAQGQRASVRTHKRGRSDRPGCPRGIASRQAGSYSAN